MILTHLSQWFSALKDSDKIAIAGIATPLITAVVGGIVALIKRSSGNRMKSPDVRQIGAVNESEIKYN